MNKELYIKREQNLILQEKLKVRIDYLEYFLKKYETSFKKEESIEALKRIKEYLEIIKKEYYDNKINQKQLYKEFYTTCNHEVAIKYYNTYHCLICDCNLGGNNDKIPHQPIISINTEDYEVLSIMKETFEQVVHSDKDLIETITKIIEEIQYEKDIKVYRRSK